MRLLCLNRGLLWEENGGEICESVNLEKKRKRGRKGCAVHLIVGVVEGVGAWKRETG